MISRHDTAEEANNKTFEVLADQPLILRSYAHVLEGMHEDARPIIPF